MVMNKQKQFWESSGIHSTNFSNTVEQKNKKTPVNNLTKREGKQLHFDCIIPSTRPTLLSTKREHSSLKQFPSLGNGGQGRRPAPLPFWYTVQKIYFGFTPLRDWQSQDLWRGFQTRKKGRSYQYQYQYTEKVITFPSGLLCRGPQRVCWRRCPKMKERVKCFPNIR